MVSMGCFHRFSNYKPLTLHVHEWGLLIRWKRWLVAAFALFTTFIWVEDNLDQRTKASFLIFAQQACMIHHIHLFRNLNYDWIYFTVGKSEPKWGIIRIDTVKYLHSSHIIPTGSQINSKEAAKNILTTSKQYWLCAKTKKLALLVQVLFTSWDSSNFKKSVNCVTLAVQ